jgi:hypothetical protein
LWAEPCPSSLATVLRPGLQLILDQMQRKTEVHSGIVSDDYKGTLYHYTDEGGLRGVLSNRCLWATHYSQLNDANEFVEGEKLIRGLAAELTASIVDELRAGKNLTNLEVLMRQDFRDNYDAMTLTKLMRNFYVASLTDLEDDLGQWRAYGKGGPDRKDAAGFCIGFRWGNLPPGAGEGPKTFLGAMLLQAAYDPDAIRARIRAELLDAFAGVQKYVTTYGIEFGEDLPALLSCGMAIAFNRAGAIVPRIKHKSFHAEREWRIVILPSADAPPGTVKTRSGRDGATIEYVEFPIEPWNTTTPIELDVVYVGPAQGAGSLAKARDLLASLGYDPNLAKASESPFRG